MTVTIDGTTGITTPADTVSGNLTFTGTGNRITGDFSNATIASRTLTQTSTADSSTNFGIIPNGTATSSLLTVFNNSTPTNSSVAQLWSLNTEISVRSAITGTGTYLPMTFYTSNSERVRIDTNGLIGIKGAASTSWSSTYQVIQYNGGPALWSANNTNINLSSNIYNDGSNRYITSTSGAYINVGTSGASLISVQSGTAGNTVTVGASFVANLTDCVMTSANGGLGYGTGAGGTVTQATNKSTAVTLNKPTGQITMNNAALASNATVSFTVSNSLVASTDTVILASVTSSATYTAILQSLSAGQFVVRVTNISGGSLSDALPINFAVIKGATS